MTAASCRQCLRPPMTTRIVAGRRLQTHIEQTEVGGAILVATDGEPESADAVKCAVQLSRQTGMPFQVLAVLEPYVLDIEADTARIPPVDPLAAREGMLHRRVLDQLREIIGDQTVGINMQYGRVAPVIAEASRAWRTALIVTGLGHPESAASTMASETALRIAAAAPVPSLLVSPGCVAAPMSIVVATDFSDASNRAAEAVMEIVPDGAEIILLHVNPFFGAVSSAARKWHAVYVSGVRSLFDELVETLQAANDRVTIRTALVAGRPDERVLEICALIGADLIAAGRHEPPATRGERLHGTIATLIRGATCSVLVVP